MRSEPGIYLRGNQNRGKVSFLKITPSENLFCHASSLGELGELSKILDRKHFLTEAAIEMFLENSCTFYGRQIIPLKIVL